MIRLLSIASRTLLLAIVVCSIPRAAAAEPEGGRPNVEPRAEPGVLEKNLPLVVGGVSTVFILGVGFVLLSGKRAESRPKEYAEPLPPDVVQAPNPLRYLVAPAAFVVLLAVGLPLGYSIWNSMPTSKSLIGPSVTMPPANGFHGTGIEPVQFPEFKVTPLPLNPTVNFNPPPRMPQPAPGFTPVKPPQLPRR
jgi:hypothetical protein